MLFLVYFRKWVLHPIKRRLAKYYLSLLRNIFGLKVVAITGSAGKTTTKEMIKSILDLVDNTVSSYKNIDPVYNIPTTILRCRPATKFLVLELGIEYPGEMDFYLWLGKPDIAVITNISQTHLQYFVEVNGVFREKKKLVECLDEKKFAVLNADDRLLVSLKNKLRSNIIYFGKDANVTSSNEKILDNGSSKFKLIIKNGENKTTDVTLPIIGKQFILNALAAAAVGRCLGIDINTIKKGLENYELPEHRMKLIKLKQDSFILDDSYNNNPAAAQNAINTFFSVKKLLKKVIVFGDMLELGKDEIKYHREIGKLIEIHKKDFIKLICIGKLSAIMGNEIAKNIGSRKVSNYNNWEEAYAEVESFLTKNVIILIKGSRGISLDKLVDRLCKR